jgi:hypothetical protein
MHETERPSWQMPHFGHCINYLLHRWCFHDETKKPSRADLIQTFQCEKAWIGRCANARIPLNDEQGKRVLQLQLLDSKNVRLMSILMGLWDEKMVSCSHG